MLRRSISFMLAGLLTAGPIWITAFAGDTGWIPHGIVPVAVAFSFIAGIMWLYDEISELLRGR